MFTYSAIVALCALAVTSAFNSALQRHARVSPLLMADIVDTAVAAGSFKTLVAAVSAAGLVPTLKGPGPFTVFAPSDEAFAKLPAGTVEALLKDIPKLSSILTYHVVAGAVKSDAVMTLDGKSVATVNGATVGISVADGVVKVNGAKVVSVDITTDNGIIHVIDSVLLPPAPVPAAPATPAFNPKVLAGVSGPFGFFDPIGICPDTEDEFRKYRESEIKHGRVAMLAFLGIVVGESSFNFFGDSINGPAIFQFQQADDFFNAFTANVIGLTLAIEGYNIVNGWQPLEQTLKSETGIAGLKKGYVNGDLKFDPLGLKPKGAEALKTIQTKEINNGRLAMLGVAGIVAQELVTGQSIF